MARTVALLLASATALVPPAATPARPATRLAYTASEALPFMERPASLDELEMAGDVGFDPFGFSSVFNVKWLREAEIKHGRICMLAWTGFVATDLGFTLPGDMHQVSSVEAHDVACKYGAMQQIFLWLSFIEVVHSFGVAQMMWMGSDRQPGDFGLDPLDFLDAGEGGGHEAQGDHALPARHVRVLGRRDAGRAHGQGLPLLLDEGGLVM